MKITKEMLHPDIRHQGILLRKMFRFENPTSFSRAQKILQLTPKVAHPSNLLCQEYTVQTKENPRLRLCTYRSKESAPDAAGLLWLHGGGYAIGAPEQEVAYIQRFVQAANCVVVAPAYRCSLQQPYPAALQDAYSALLWMKQNAVKLGINSDQLFVGGNSAGGGLAVAVALRARDTGEVNIAFQMPLYPMLDDRMQTSSAQNNDAPVWNSKANEAAWKLYLGPLYGTSDVPPYAAPARERDFSGLPPAYTFVGDIEPFHDETLAYIRQLRAAGVPAVLDVYPGCFHGFNVAFPKASVSQQATKKYLSAFAIAAENCFAPQ